MPSVYLGYTAGSGFSPLVSGNPWSGHSLIGGMQIRAHPSNSGNVYISLSGGNFFSGQLGTLVTSGGPTINSGGMPLSGGALSGMMDGFPLAPGDAYFVPKIAVTSSGLWGICVGCDTIASGFARVNFEVF